MLYNDWGIELTGKCIRITPAQITDEAFLNRVYGIVRGLLIQEWETPENAPAIF